MSVYRGRAEVLGTRSNRREWPEADPGQGGRPTSAFDP